MNRSTKKFDVFNKLLMSKGKQGLANARAKIGLGFARQIFMMYQHLTQLTFRTMRPRP